MKLLFDQNLSPHLVELLADVFPASLHVRLVGLERADDDSIWRFARDHGFAIVTKDSGRLGTADRLDSAWQLLQAGRRGAAEEALASHRRP